MNVHIANLLRQNETGLALTELEQVTSSELFVLKDYESFSGFLALSKTIVCLPFNKNVIRDDNRQKAARYLYTHPSAAYGPEVVTYLNTSYPPSSLPPAIQ